MTANGQHPPIELRSAAVLYMKGWVDGYVKAAGEDSLEDEAMEREAQQAYERFLISARDPRT